jgi:hypothetical protein
MNFWKSFQKHTTRQERVDLMIAMIMKYQKFTWEGARYRLRDATENSIGSILLVTGVIAVLLFADVQLVPSAFDLVVAIGYLLALLFLVTSMRNNAPEFGLATLMAVLSILACIVALAMLWLPQSPIFIAITGVLGTALTISVGLHWLVHFIQINLPNTFYRES